MRPIWWWWRRSRSWLIVRTQLVEASAALGLVEPFDDACSRTRRSTSAESGLVSVGEVLLELAAQLGERVADERARRRATRASVARNASACCSACGSPARDALGEAADRVEDGAAERMIGLARRGAELGRGVAAHRLDELPLHEAAAQQHRHEALAAGAQRRGRAVEPEAQLLGGTRAVGEVRDRRRDAREGGLRRWRCGRRSRASARSRRRSGSPASSRRMVRSAKRGDLGLGQEARGAAQDVAERAAEAADVLGIAEPVDDRRCSARTRRAWRRSPPGRATRPAPSRRCRRRACRGARR